MPYNRPRFPSRSELHPKKTEDDKNKEEQLLKDIETIKKDNDTLKRVIHQILNQENYELQRQNEAIEIDYKVKIAELERLKDIMKRLKYC